MKNALLTLFLFLLPASAAQQTILLTPGGTTLAAGGAMINANFTELYARAFDSDITLWAGITPSANGASLVSAANYAAMRGLLDLEAGTDFYSMAAAAAAFQALDADLTSWALVTRASGFDTFAATASSANLRGLLTDESGTGVFLTANGVGSALTLTASGFNGNLTTTDDTLQEVAQKLDDLSISGGTGDVASDTIWNAAGDLAIGTGADTAARLAIGTPGQLLHVNAGSTAPEWTSAPSVTNLTVTGTATIPAINYNGALGTDDTASATRLTGLLAGSTIAQWEAVYIGGSSTYLLADANGSGTFPVRGLAIAAYSSTNAATIITSGTVRNDAWTWTPGGTIYLSTTAGGLTQTVPATTGDKIQVIGYALTADIMMVAISPDYGTAP